MCNKKEDYFCDAIVSSMQITLLLVIFFLGYSFIYYSNMDYSSKVSSGFSFISSLGILATIVVYFLQKKDSKNKEKTEDDFNNNSHNKIIYDEGMKIKQSLEQLVIIKKSIICNNGIAQIIMTAGTFYFIKTKDKKELPLQLRREDSMRELYISSSSCSDDRLYKSARFIYEANNQIYNYWVASLVFCDLDDGILYAKSNKFLSYWLSTNLDMTLTAINYALQLIKSDNNFDESSFFHKSTNENDETVITIKKPNN